MEADALFEKAFADYLGMPPDQAISTLGESADSLMQLGVTTDGYFVAPEKICTVH